MGGDGIRSTKWVPSTVMMSSEDVVLLKDCVKKMNLITLALFAGIFVWGGAIVFMRKSFSDPVIAYGTLAILAMVDLVFYFVVIKRRINKLNQDIANRKKTSFYGKIEKKASGKVYEFVVDAKRFQIQKADYDRVEVGDYVEIWRGDSSGTVLSVNRYSD